jgi:hypothetical protein
MSAVSPKGARALPDRAVGTEITGPVRLIGLFFAYDREHALAKVVVALVGSAGSHYVFERFLRVPLPDVTLPALRTLGF